MNTDKALTSTTSSQQSLRILLVQGNPLLRCGTQSVLEHALMQVIGGTTEPEEIFRLVVDAQPDVIVLDGNLLFHHGSKTALNLTVHIRQLRRQCGILVLVDRPDELQMAQFLLAGASAYEWDQISCDALVEKIRRVADGEYLIGSEDVETAYLSRMNIQRLLRLRQHNREREESLSEPEETRTETASLAIQENTPFDLTERQIEVLLCVRYGMANRVIADHLALSDETVKNHITQIFHRMDVHDRTTAVVTALRHGIIRYSDPMPARQKKTEPLQSTYQETGIEREETKRETKGA